MLNSSARTCAFALSLFLLAGCAEGGNIRRSAVAERQVLFSPQALPSNRDANGKVSDLPSGMRQILSLVDAPSTPEAIERATGWKLAQSKDELGYGPAVAAAVYSYTGNEQDGNFYVKFRKLSWKNSVQFTLSIEMTHANALETGYCYLVAASRRDAQNSGWYGFRNTSTFVTHGYSAIKKNASLNITAKVGPGELQDSMRPNYKSNFDYSSGCVDTITMDWNG